MPGETYMQSRLIEWTESLISYVLTHRTTGTNLLQPKKGQIGITCCSRFMYLCQLNHQNTCDYLLAGRH